MVLSKYLRYILDSNYRFMVNSNKVQFLCEKESDDEAVAKIFKATLGEELNLDNPSTFNEKLQWLKLNDHNPLYSDLVDKYEVKKIVEKIVGNDHIIKNLGVWDSFDRIDFNSLPNQFVLKCTHDSGGLVICKNKESFDYSKAKCVIEKSLKRNYYLVGREWPYKNVKPRIIAEEYMGDNICDYKFFCFNGTPQLCLVCSERFEGEPVKEDFYDMDWNHLNIKRPGHDNASLIQRMPISFFEMIEQAKELSKGIPFVRVDYYEINGVYYFGELTFYPASGFEGFEPAEWDNKLGRMLLLPN